MALVWSRIRHCHRFTPHSSRSRRLRFLFHRKYGFRTTRAHFLLVFSKKSFGDRRPPLPCGPINPKGFSANRNPIFAVDLPEKRLCAVVGIHTPDGRNRKCVHAVRSLHRSLEVLELVGMNERDAAASETRSGQTRSDASGRIPC